LPCWCWELSAGVRLCECCGSGFAAGGGLGGLAGQAGWPANVIEGARVRPGPPPKQPQSCVVSDDVFAVPAAVAVLDGPGARKAWPVPPLPARDAAREVILEPGVVTVPDPPR
jgi:hypothetical protein